MEKFNYQNLKQKTKKINNPNIISIILIGSYVHKNKLEKINDIDFLVVVKSLDKEKLQRIKSEFRKIKNSFENEKLKIILELRRGPVKPKPEKGKKVVQFHLLIWEIEKLKKNIRNPILLDAINFGKTMKGKPLKKIKNVDKLTKKDLVKDFNLKLKAMQIKGVLVGEYRFIEDELIESENFINLPKEKHSEIFSNIIITSFMNFCRYENSKTKKDEKILLKKAKKILDREYFNILRNSFTIKEKIRKGRNITQKEFENLEKDGKKFVRYLKKLTWQTLQI